MSSRIVPFDFQGQAVAFNSDGWINATEAAARFGKRPVDWLRLDETAAYVEAMAGALGLESKVSQNHFGLARASRGGKSPGTWLHPKLAVRFAQWRDSVLIGQGLAYGERKTNLLKYVQQLLSKRIGRSAA